MVQGFLSTVFFTPIYQAPSFGFPLQLIKFYIALFSCRNWQIEIMTDMPHHEYGVYKNARLLNNARVTWINQSKIAKKNSDFFFSPGVAIKNIFFSSPSQQGRVVIKLTVFLLLKKYRPIFFSVLYLPYSGNTVLSFVYNLNIPLYPSFLYTLLNSCCLQLLRDPASKVE